MASKKKVKSSWYKKANWILAGAGIILLIFNFMSLLSKGEVNDLLLILLSIATIVWILLDIFQRRKNKK